MFTTLIDGCIPSHHSLRVTWYRSRQTRSFKTRGLTAHLFYFIMHSAAGFVSPFVSFVLAYLLLLSPRNATPVSLMPFYSVQPRLRASLFHRALSLGEELTLRRLDLGPVSEKKRHRFVVAHTPGVAWLSMHPERKKKMEMIARTL